MDGNSPGKRSLFLLSKFVVLTLWFHQPKIENFGTMTEQNIGVELVLGYFVKLYCKIQKESVLILDNAVCIELKLSRSEFHFFKIVGQYRYEILYIIIMKIKATCQECSSGPFLDNNLKIGIVTINEKGLYYFTCDKGHNNLFQMQAFPFELLFESGLCAIKEGFYMESILSLTASLERFYEFFVNISLKANLLPNEVVKKVLDKMSQQSERKLGAFICLYSFIYKRFPSCILEKKTVEFRNKVVHKGYLPNESEALNYGEEVYNAIRSEYCDLVNSYKDIIFQYLIECMTERIKGVDSPVGTMLFPLSISLLHIDGMQTRDFNECYDHVKKYYNYNGL